MKANYVNEGLLVVISGPSGVGKGTVCKALREMMPELTYSISATTRSPVKEKWMESTIFSSPSKSLKK